MPDLQVQPPGYVKEGIHPEIERSTLRIDDLIERKGDDRENDDKQAKALAFDRILDLPCVERCVNEKRCDERMTERLSDVHARIGIVEG